MGCQSQIEILPKMKHSLSLCLVAAVLGVVLSDDTYTSRFDNIDLDEILSNQRLYKSYFECLTSEGKCTTEGKTLKDALPDALANACSKCTEKQKQGSEKVFRYLINNKAEDYAKLEKIYDPEGVYKKKYESEAKRVGIPTK